MTHWVTAEHLLTVASEKSCDTCCSIMKKKSDLTPKVTQQHFFAAYYNKDRHAFISPKSFSPTAFTVRGFEDSLHEPNGRNSISLCRLRVFLSAHVFITKGLMSLTVSLPAKLESEKA